MNTQTADITSMSDLSSGIAGPQRFALIGDHPDGLEMARALVESGHELTAYAGPKPGAERLEEWGLRFESVRDVEEVLARAEIETVIVADDLDHRPAVLRRAVQSEKHVLCVHPADLKPDIAYEAAMIQADTRKLLLPLLAERFAPGLVRLEEICRGGTWGKITFLLSEQPLHVGQVFNLSYKRVWDGSPLFFLWDALRQIGGEIAEVSALSSSMPGASQTSLLQPQDQLTLTGRFEVGGLFQVLLLATGNESQSRLLVHGERGQAELVFPQGPFGPARLTFSSEAGKQTEEWPAWNPWKELAEAFNRSLAGRPQSLSWVDGIRCLELFDAAKYSAAKGRVVPMHYQDYTETASFKGLMTLIGCGMLWLVLLLLIAGIWLPWVPYLIVPLLVLFLALQVFRWALPAKGRET